MENDGKHIENICENQGKSPSSPVNGGFSAAVEAKS